MKLKPALHYSLLWLIMLLFCACEKENFVDNSPHTGEGGSFARFTIVGNYLYSVDASQLHIYDISQAAIPVLAATVPIGMGIETIFPFNNYLFIGANQGMFIYDISNPLSPSNGISFEHAAACDPVVANDSLAFITLRSSSSGNTCNQSIVESGLYIVDIKDIQEPKQINFISMLEPYGLGYDGNTLFVCAGAEGLLVYDYTDPLNLVQLAHIPNFTTYDVIPVGGILLVVGPDEFRQYDYTDLQDIQLISTTKYAL